MDDSISATNALAANPQVVTSQTEEWAGRVAHERAPCGVRTPEKGKKLGQCKGKTNSKKSGNQTTLVQTANGGIGVHKRERAPVGRQAHSTTSARTAHEHEDNNVDASSEGLDGELGEDDDDQHRCAPYQMKFAQECKDEFSQGREFIFHPTQYGIRNCHDVNTFMSQKVIMWYVPCVCVC